MSEILNVSARTVSRRLRLFHLKRTYATISDDELDDVIRETVAYRVARPNSMWHLHGNHKIIRWRIVIHGGIHGFSPLVVFLKASDNNRSTTVMDSFLGAVSKFGMPSRVGTDHGALSAS